MAEKGGAASPSFYQFGAVQEKSWPLIRLSVAEIRHLFWSLVLNVQRTLQHVLAWSHWRRHHQAVAMFHHYKRRGALPGYLQL